MTADACHVVIYSKAGATNIRNVFMAIGNAVERGSLVCIYDEKGFQTASVSAGSGPNDGLKGYTSSSVNVQRGPFIFTHDEKGQVIRSVSVR